MKNHNERSMVYKWPTYTRHVVYSWWSW